MRAYQITCRLSGREIVVVGATDPDDAREALATRSGYQSFRELARAMDMTTTMARTVLEARELPNVEVKPVGVKKLPLPPRRLHG
jgi:hypothetical protein